MIHIFSENTQVFLKPLLQAEKKTQLTIYINNFPPAVLYRASKSG